MLNRVSGSFPKPTDLNGRRTISKMCRITRPPQRPLSQIATAPRTSGLLSPVFHLTKDVDEEQSHNGRRTSSKECRITWPVTAASSEGKAEVQPLNRVSGSFPKPTDLNGRRTSSKECRNTRPPQRPLSQKAVAPRTF